jgi:hypothetical protein
MREKLLRTRISCALQSLVAYSSQHKGQLVPSSKVASSGEVVGLRQLGGPLDAEGVGVLRVADVVRHLLLLDGANLRRVPVDEEVEVVDEVLAPVDAHELALEPLALLALDEPVVLFAGRRVVLADNVEVALHLEGRHRRAEEVAVCVARLAVDALLGADDVLVGAAGDEHVLLQVPANLLHARFALLTDEGEAGAEGHADDGLPVVPDAGEVALGDGVGLNGAARRDGFGARGEHDGEEGEAFHGRFLHLSKKRAMVSGLVLSDSETVVAL